ncbi:hypothetical protein GCM10020254_46370 [Streptomyces goshikiensis]
MVVHQHRRRRVRAGGVVLAVGVAVTVAALAACGGAADAGAGAGGDGKPPADPAGAVAAVRAAADALTAAGSARVRTAMEMAAGGTRVTIRGEGGVDFLHRMGQLLVMLPADAAGKDEHRPITELLVPGALYMKNRGAGVPDDKWVRVDTATLGDGNLVTGGATDPLAAAELLRGAQEVTYVGGRPRWRAPGCGTTGGRPTSGGRRAVPRRTSGERWRPRRKGSARTPCRSTRTSTTRAGCGRSATVSVTRTMA